MSYDEWKLRSPDDDRELQEGRQYREDNSAYALGYSAWNADVPFHENPFVDDDDATSWCEGWLSAKSDNGQFGVGA